MGALLAITGLFVVVLVAFLILVQRLLHCGEAASIDRQWLEGFSVAKYRPMERLLSEDDFRFLASQPGYEPEIARRLRRERRAVFCGYLRMLRTDFNRLHSMARLVVLYSPQDRSDLAAVLFRLKMSFFWGWGQVYARVWLHTLGVQPVQITGLLEILDGLRSEVLRASPAMGAA